jgi:predicted P-loop ATPase
MAFPFRCLVTRFDDRFATSLVAEELGLEDLKEVAETTVAPTKEALLLVKYARYGSKRSADNSLRHDDNVLGVSGCEIDVDHAGGMSFDEACSRFAELGVRFFGYTTPSHTPQDPHFRFFFPFSKELPPAERARMVARANGVLAGIASAESFALSTAFYIGSVIGQPPCETYLGDDEVHLDELDELDAGAMFFRAPPGTKPPSKPGAGAYDNLDEGEALSVVEAGEHLWGPSKRFLQLCAQQGVTEADAENNLRAAFDRVPQGKRNKKWSKYRNSIPKWVRSVYTKVARRSRASFGALVDYLETAAHWQGVLRLNDLFQTVETALPFPPQSGQTVGTFYRTLRDPADVLEAVIAVQAGAFPHASKGLVRDALALVASRHAFHPIRVRLDGLTWDGEERVDRLFIDYFCTDLPEDPDLRDKKIAYLEHIGRGFTIGAVARVYEPGCKVDQVPILEGRQGVGKSRGLRALALNPDWFSDDLSPDLAAKDTKDSLLGKWLFELAEIPHLHKQVDRVKGFFSRQTDRYRRAYDVTSRDWPRQCVFAGSSNNLELPDETGNRRLWPVGLILKVDVAAITRDAEQLWAEAVHLYKAGVEWWLPPPIEALAAELQAGYVEEDRWVGLITEWLVRTARLDPQTLRPFEDASLGQTTGNSPARNRPFAMSDVLEGIGFSLNPADERRATKGDEMRAARCLRQLGFRRDPLKRQIHGKRDRFWLYTL